MVVALAYLDDGEEPKGQAGVASGHKIESLCDLFREIRAK
jgi:hypothetical protein